MSAKYVGMTVNERLYISGQLDNFDIAVKEKDINKLTTILRNVELTDPSINAILENLNLSNQ